MDEMNLPEDVEYDSYYINVQATTWKSACDLVRPLLVAKGLTVEQVAFICHERKDCTTTRGQITCTWGKPTQTKDGFMFEIDRNLIHDRYDKMLHEAMPLKIKIVTKRDVQDLFEAVAVEIR